MQGRSSLGRGKEIEAELGKLLKWDESLRLWVGKKFVKTLEEIHRIIKEEFPDKLVLYWQHTGYATLDDIGFLLPKGAPLSTPGLYWYRYSDIIKPGLCDAFMAYPNNQKGAKIHATCASPQPAPFQPTLASGKDEASTLAGGSQNGQGEDAPKPRLLLLLRGGIAPPIRGGTMTLPFLPIRSGI